MIFMVFDSLVTVSVFLLVADVVFTATYLAKLDVPVKLLIDSAVAYSMDEVDMVFVQFTRLYPLDQKDMVAALRPVDFGVPIPSKVEVERLHPHLNI
ncbi:translation initiation factor eIF-2B subunit alpha-like protein [Tanacetum coccineum]